MCPPAPTASSPPHSPPGQAPASDPSAGLALQRSRTVLGSGNVKSKPAFQLHLRACPLPLRGLCSPFREWLASCTPCWRASHQGRAADREVVNKENFEGNSPYGRVMGDMRLSSQTNWPPTLDFFWKLPELSEPPERPR